MLYHLAHPTELAGIIVGLILALFAHNFGQVWAGHLFGDTTPRRSGFSNLALNRHIGPYAAVTAVLLGTGWAEPVPVEQRFRRSERRAAGILLAGPVSAALVALLAAGVARLALGSHASPLLVGSDTAGLATAVAAGGSAISRFLLFTVGAAGTFALLSILPIPPLAGGRILFLLAPHTQGWQRARVRLVEGHIGTYIVLALLIGPLLLNGLPRVVPQLATPLIATLLRLVGFTVVSI